MSDELKAALEDITNSINELDASLKKYCSKTMQGTQEINSEIEKEVNTTLKNHKKIREIIG